MEGVCNLTIEQLREDYNVKGADDCPCCGFLVGRHDNPRELSRASIPDEVIRAIVSSALMSYSMNQSHRPTHGEPIGHHGWEVDSVRSDLSSRHSENASVQSEAVVFDKYYQKMVSFLAKYSCRISLCKEKRTYKLQYVDNRGYLKSKARQMTMTSWKKEYHRIKESAQMTATTKRLEPRPENGEELLRRYVVNRNLDLLGEYRDSWSSSSDF